MRYRRENKETKKKLIVQFMKKVSEKLKKQIFICKFKIYIDQNSKAKIKLLLLKKLN